MAVLAGVLGCGAGIEEFRVVGTVGGVTADAGEIGALPLGIGRARDRVLAAEGLDVPAVLLLGMAPGAERIRRLEQALRVVAGVRSVAGRAAVPVERLVLDLHLVADAGVALQAESVPFGVREVEPEIAAVRVVAGG